MQNLTAERRAFAASIPTATGRTVSGYAALYNVKSSNLGTEASPIFEIIAPGAFDGRLTDDVVCRLNHEDNLLLARCNGGRGTLKLSIDSRGLFYRFEAPQTSAGNDLLENIKLGNLTQSSFAFSVQATGERWSMDGKAKIRTITRVAKLIDVAPVIRPAYAETSVSARNKSGVAAIAMTAAQRANETAYWAARFGI